MVPTATEALVPAFAATHRGGVPRGAGDYPSGAHHLLPGSWTVRTCRACGDIMSGPSIACESCSQVVNGHCATRRLGTVVCRVCASDLDYQLHQHRAHHVLAQSSLQLGRFVQGASSLTGHALGAVTTTAAAGAARLVAGLAGGAASAYTAARSIEFAPAPPPPPRPQAESVDDSPVRPRQLEEFGVSLDVPVLGIDNKGALNGIERPMA